MKPNPIRWTENELELEIERLHAMIAETGDGRDLRARCTVAYLRQVMRDRRETLATLRHVRSH